MSAPRLLGLLLLGAVALARPAVASTATDSVLVRVGGDLAGRAGQYIDVPVTVDLSGAPGRSLGSYTARLAFDTTVFTYEGVTNGNFAVPQVNAAHAPDSGKVVVTAIQPPGASGAIQIFIARFYVRVDTIPSPITVSFTEMSATATSVTPFESLLPLLRIVNGTFCRSLGRWGDLDGDGLSNSFDALVVLSNVVGDTLPLTVNAALGDVDGDGRVTSRDALIILSYAVGLPVPGTRVLLVAAGACGTGVAANLTITPDSLELQVGQEVPASVAALDSTGRPVPVDSVKWSSSDPSVAALDATSGMVQARGPGLATLTVQLGPGIWGTLRVSVLARRTTWYVDVERARFAPTQTGSQNLPFEYIGDALDLAHNGDTVQVAGGVYEELVSASVAVTIHGDSTNRPVLDPRGAGSSWYQYDDALDLEPYAGRVELAHLDIRAGQTYIGAHDLFVHDVLIEGLNTQGTGLQFYSSNLTPAPTARPGGPMRSSIPVAPGNALIDRLAITGDSLNYGILIELADTALIRNSSVSRAQAGTYTSCGFGPYTYGGIVVQQASVSLAQNNTVANPDCQGIGLFDNENSTLVSALSRVTASRNRVSGAPGTGIALGARFVSSDHNAVDSTGRVPGDRSYGNAVGIHVTSSYACECNGGPPADSVVIVGDTVRNSGGRGVAVDTAMAAILDSLVVINTGMDSSGTAAGVNLTRGGTYWLMHSRVSNTVHSAGVLFTGEHTNLHTRGNYIVGTGEDGLTTYESCYCSAPVRPSGPALAGAPGPQRTGPYTGGPDTLISVADTIRRAGSNGIFMEWGVYAQVDSGAVDTVGGDGILLQYIARASARNTAVRNAYYGFYGYYVDSLRLVGDTAQSNAYGLYVSNSGNTADTVRIAGSWFASNSSDGIYLYYNPVLVDSSVMVNNGTGLFADYYSPARVRWSRFQTNKIGMEISGYGNASSVVNSNFLSDTTAGVLNSSDGPMLTADTNYWGDPVGPRCPVSVTGCDSGSVAGDSIGPYGITFANWLTSAAPTLAPPLRIASVPAPPARVRQSAEPPVILPPRPPAPKMATRESFLAAQSQRRQPPAWHAPSKARTHAVQVLVRNRTKPTAR